MHFQKIFGPIRAHMGAYGSVWARMGPARALEEREKFRKNEFASVSNVFSQKHKFWPSICRYLIIWTCSSDFLPKYASERLWNYLKKQVLEPKRAILVPPAPCLNILDQLIRTGKRFGCSATNRRGGTPKQNRDIAWKNQNVACFGSKTCFFEVIS